MLGWPPLRVSYLLPVNVMIRGDMPTVATWDPVSCFMHVMAHIVLQEKNQWTTDGISDIAFDPPTKTIVFSTVHVRRLAVIQVMIFILQLHSLEFRIDTLTFRLIFGC
jgi:hypothetical protein